MLGIKTAHRLKICVHGIKTYTAVGVYIYKSGNKPVSACVYIAVFNIIGDICNFPVLYCDRF